MQAPFLDQNKTADEYRVRQQVAKIPEISTCQNFKAWLRGQLPTYQGVRYMILNLTLWAITT